MMKAAIGIDLCSDYTAIHIHGNEEAVVIPTVICRDRDTEHFFIGGEAYRKTLKGEGILVDKLLRLAARKGTATIGGTCYEGRDLLAIFLKKAVCFPSSLASLRFSASMFIVKYITFFPCLQAMSPSAHAK